MRRPWSLRVLTLVHVLLLVPATMAARVLTGPGGTSLWYPAAAVTLAYLYATGWRGVLPAITARVVTSSLFAGLPADGADWLRRVLTSVVVILAYQAVVVVNTRHDRHHRRTRTPKAMVVFVGVAGLLGPLAAAFSSRGVAALLSVGATTDFVDASLSFAVGDAVAIVTLVPLLVRLREGRGVPVTVDVLRVVVPATVTCLVAAFVAVTVGAGDLVFLVGIPLTIVAVWGGAGWFGAALAATTTTMVVAMATAGPVAGFSVATNNLMLWTVGAAGLVVAAATDQRGVVRRELAAARDRADEIFDRAMTPAIELTTTGTVVRTNDAFLTLDRSTGEDVVGRPMSQVLDVPDTLDLTVRNELTASIRHRDGSRSVGLLVTTPTGATTDAASPVVAQFIDLTDQFASRDALTRSNRALADFAHRVAHDLRTPLSAVVGFAQLIERDVLPPETVGEVAAMLSRSARAMSDQLDDILASAESITDVGSTSSLAALGQWVSDATAGLVAARGVELTFEVPDLVLALPFGTLRQVLVNLVQNSVRHGGPDLTRVRLTAALDGTELVVVVEDDGRGVPAADLERIFGQGVQLADTGRDGGSGLAACRALLHAVGGSVRALASERGGRFEVRLPADRTSSSAVTPLASPGVGPHATDHAGSPG